MNRPPWRIETRRQAKRVLRRLPKQILKRIEATISALAYDPLPPGSRKLVGYDNLYRIQVGDWRIIYTRQDEVMVILIVEISPRGDAYRNL
jgi:mRNA interferase RelE/StbE